MVSMNRDRRRAAKEAAATPVKAAVEKPIGGEKNGGKRLVQPKAAYYPADDVKKPLPSRKHIHKPTKLRSSITPGTILILLAGNHRGKRVVFLKQLDTGLLLVTGPYSVNGVPLRKVDQAYVIATSTKIDVSGVDVSKFDGKYFKKDKSKKSKKTEEDFMAVEGAEKKSEIPEGKVADQKTVDSAIMTELKKEEMLIAYLGARFSLTKGQYPHKMVF
uniref:60S ribosomal protein L6 n=1 Tax=Rhodosorus marinus TaxID=101924 RepID=A0A7S3A2Q9_9RHOD|mmetsp:Transcript_40130/g.159554  ORF Transcript_40130/g.159554 Transcript_40130/m.159554 type:complete len:217 (+) Transcript_40130:140-790(+)|eukprot:CAMPEP_0113955178 /NCGR_PEP_ID=MMETSP0011_2-20120614/1116_1 /TAXON_ID=101924 /ORGANISM="Rhodosorus marinus" /LENGTH=216 /DNA_ID=CAMNT_0000964693 /DNA_START=77 /DNA_END=727 /DNA_ORIENTATION=+ /assembly_acc=CAM_ASM_000156